MRDKRSHTHWKKRLKAIRERLDLTQEEAAQKLEVPVSTWRNWEQGRNEPNTGMARLIDIIFPEE